MANAGCGEATPANHCKLMLLQTGENEAKSTLWPPAFGGYLGTFILSLTFGAFFWSIPVLFSSVIP
jgi:hypothetical protein